MGAAATALGCVINALPSRADSQTGSPAPLLDKALSALQAAAENAPRLSQSTVARTGIAHGLAALLGAPHMLPDAAGGDTWLLSRADCAEHAKRALEVQSCLMPEWDVTFASRIENGMTGLPRQCDEPQCDGCRSQVDSIVRVACEESLSTWGF